MRSPSTRPSSRIKVYRLMKSIKLLLVLGLAQYFLNRTMVKVQRARILRKVVVQNILSSNLQTNKKTFVKANPAFHIQSCQAYSTIGMPILSAQTMSCFASLSFLNLLISTILNGKVLNHVVDYGDQKENNCNCN